MVVGEAPGAEEDAVGRPFVGRSGKLLNDAMEQADLDRSACFITNVVKQRPPKNRTPTPSEIEAHRPFLLKEVKEVQPSFVLLLGNIAFSTMTMWDGGIMRMRGSIKPNEHAFPSQVQVYATIHPSAALRSRDNKEIFYKDVSVFAKMVRGEYNLVPPSDS